MEPETDYNGRSGFGLEYEGTGFRCPQCGHCGTYLTCSECGHYMEGPDTDRYRGFTDTDKEIYTDD